jgi:acyl carrier protein
MQFEEARRQVIEGLDKAFGTLGDRRFAHLAESEADATFAELELDSLTQLALCLAIEDSTGVELNLGDLAVHSSVNTLAQHLVSRRND